MKQYTSGPWYALEENGTVNTGTNERVAVVIGPANRILVSAAPEMLEILQTIYKVLDTLTDNPLSERFMKEIDQVITKATTI